MEIRILVPKDIWEEPIPRSCTGSTKQNCPAVYRDSRCFKEKFSCSSGLFYLQQNLYTRTNTHQFYRWL